jgi:hypothetical protein
MTRRHTDDGPHESEGAAHRDHLEAQEEHGRWLKDLQLWRREYEAAVFRFVHRQLRDLELANFEEALDRHEAAILAHQELVERHERRLRLERRGLAEHPEEVDALHEQVHERHDLSRHQHEELARSLHAILKALEMLGSEASR